MAVKDESALDELRELVQTCPIVDNHAHNLIPPVAQRTHDFLTLSTEASGDALEDTTTSLSHFRALTQLRKLYGLPVDASWETIVEKRNEILVADPKGLVKRCFEGTQTLLIDDGLAPPADVEPYTWHSDYTKSPCKRIVRIETVAADVLAYLHRRNRLPVGVAVEDREACREAWVDFITAFENAIATSLSDDEVVGFKSVVCYRTGLGVTVDSDGEVLEAGLRSFRKHYLPHVGSGNYRVDTKGMNDALVISTCKLISASFQQTGKVKPFQFHTGLGDNDISLLESNPAYLQPLIKQFPTVPIVLLHTSYPYTREAGYLATVYKNVYLDIGEVFMMVSRDGLQKIFEQALELTPLSKILYSSDGHHFPETYWLANAHGREAIEAVMCDYVVNGDMTISQALQAVRDIFFENSNRLYGLGLKMEPHVTAVERAISADDSNKGESSVVAYRQSHKEIPTASPYDVKFLNSFLSRYPDSKFIFVQWLDFLGQIRSRCLPTSEFKILVNSGDRINISSGNLGTLQNDHMSSACNPVGNICVEPDLSSLRRMQALGAIKQAATIMSRQTDEKGNGLDLCPRSALDGVLQSLRNEYQLQFLVGFEIEVTFCKVKVDEAQQKVYSPLDTNHSWGTFSDEQYTDSLPLMLTVTSALQRIGIKIQQMHSEAGPGQYEFVLPPLPPIEAIDTLIQARQAISQIAATRGLRATYHPQPFPGIGTAAHAHVSFNCPSLPAAELDKLEMSFMASVLAHLPALCAFTMPQAVSYGRVVDDSWTGGTWIAWGTQNREVPLRRVLNGRRWEVRCLDGLANMYLALHAIFGAGLKGLRDQKAMSLGDCLNNPTKLSASEKEALGIKDKLPASISEALKSLEADKEFESALSPGIVKHYLAMKEAEQEMLAEMMEEKRKNFFMERY